MLSKASAFGTWTQRLGGAPASVLSCPVTSAVTQVQFPHLKGGYWSHPRLLGGPGELSVKVCGT